MNETPGLPGDMSPAQFRSAAHRVADLAADYLENLESLPVAPEVEPGALKRRLPQAPPSAPEPLDRILGDYQELIVPGLTHWQHPGFMAYFPATASCPGILGEWLASTLNSNVMLWKNAPSSTELEQVVVGWLRRLFGLPEPWDGMFTDTASISSLLSVLAARHAVPGLAASEEGLAGGKTLRLYCSQEAHSSIEKAAVAAGVGRKNVRKIPVDREFRMRPQELAAAIAEDRAAGMLPLCVIATLGTTSSTSIDPVGAIASIAEAQSLWLHVDAAYGGNAAVVPELRDLFTGWERADSIVVNPHKWLFTPFDASLLLFRKAETFRDAFSLVPEYLRAPGGEETRNFHEYGLQLGRRFRALKLWFLIRHFGADGLAAMLREHCRMALEFASWIDADPDWERLAPVPLAVVCYRYRPAALTGREQEPEVAAKLDALNEAILHKVNRTGKIYLSHTRLAGRFTLRIALGNPRASMDHVRLCWDILRGCSYT